MKIVNPQGTAARPRELLPLAPRMSALRGRRIGVVVNEPGSALITNWEEMSRQLTVLLVEREGVIAGPRVIKPHMSSPAPASVIDAMAEGSDAVVNGLGK